MGNREVVLQLRLSMRLVAVASVILALALGVAAVGTVFAQSTTTTINGCVSNKSGALRVVNSPSACKSGETAISWNQQGPQGPQGIQGPQGNLGQPGVNGENGKTILNGDGAPATDLGGAGDYYIDNESAAIYGPKTTNGWGTPTSLVGPPGTGGTPKPSTPSTRRISCGRAAKPPTPTCSTDRTPPPSRAQATTTTPATSSRAPERRRTPRSTSQGP